MADEQFDFASSQQGTLLARHIVESFPNGAIYVVDRELRILFAGGRALEAAGISASSLIGRTLMEALPPAVADEFISPCERAFEGESVEFEHRYGEDVYTMVVVPLDRNDLVTTVLLVSRNITREKEAEEESHRRLLTSEATAERELRMRLRAEGAEAQFRALFEATADPIVVFDVEGNYTNANQAACELLGYPREELLTLNVTRFAADAETARQEFAQFLQQGRWRGELDLLRRNGSIVPVEAHAAALPTPDGTTYVCVFRDMTQRREVETIQKEFLSAVAHELRNPLTPILGFARILKRLKKYEEAVVDDILHHAQILERRLDDLLETTRIDDGQVSLNTRQTDLADLARESVRQTQALNPGYTIELAAPDTPVNGAWDRHRLEQVITNLLSNAVKYSPEGSEISVTVEVADNEAKVTVTDHGMGIPEEQLGLLFKRFLRTTNARERSVKGFGLGLYVARGLVEAHGGRMWAYSEGVGKGSTFGFVLPVRRLTPELP